jgi:NAD+ diphosphatase
MLCFPKLAPAVITLVEHEDKALLARGKTFGPNPMYSALAGFVEPGESLEETVAREIKEEVGIEVTNIRYFKSQPWPFPHSLMIGFQADYGSGEIVCDPTEIVDAQWFTRDDLPNLPGRLSIARWLIDDWLNRPEETKS